MSTTGSLSQYATHIKSSPAYVTKLKKQGRLVMRQEGDRQVVDFELSDRLVKNTTDMARARNGANAQPDRLPSLPVQSMADSGRIDAVFRQAQAQDKAYSAKLTELNYRKAIGEVVSAAEVEAEQAAVFATFREAMLQISARLSPVLAAETSQARVHELLDDGIRSALLHLKGRFDGGA